MLTTRPRPPAELRADVRAACANRPGIYRMMGPGDEVLYVGKSIRVRTRLLSFGMILGLAFLLAVSLLVSAALAMVGKWWDQWLGGWEVLAHVLDVVINLACTMGGMGFISRYHAQILHNNLLISTHTLEAARVGGDDADAVASCHGGSLG